MLKLTPKHLKKRRFWTIKLNTLDVNEILGSDLAKRAPKPGLRAFLSQKSIESGCSTLNSLKIDRRVLKYG